MDDTRILPNLRPAATPQDGAAHPHHVSAAVATVASDGAAQRIAVFQSLAAVPVWRSSVAGGAAPRAPARHVVGGARATAAITHVAAAISTNPASASVALPDGTRITFGSVGIIPELEPA